MNAKQKLIAANAGKILEEYKPFISLTKALWKAAKKSPDF